MTRTRRSPSTKPRRRRRRTRRPAIAVLVVLALVSVALTMSYAILRSQMAAMQMQSNSTRRDQARQAALAGLSAALRDMRLASWAGVGSVIDASLDATDSYSVTFTAGDASLAPGDADYDEYPFRVTLTSTGTSVDPLQPSRTSSYQVQAVVRLVARALSTAPSDWSTMLGYTVYQRDKDKMYVAVPCHVEGPVRAQGEIDVKNAYSWSNAPQSRYFSDLNQMRTGANEVQTVTRSGGISGTFKLTFNGATTGHIAFNASSSTVRAALEGLATIGTGNVAVSGGGSTWTVTFQGTLAGTDVPAMTADEFVFGGTVFVTTTSQGVAGMLDYRPFSGPISAPTSEQNTDSMNLLLNELGLSINDIATSTTPAPSSGPIATYRIYPGGPSYDVGSLPSTVSNAVLEPDPITNPLGLFYSSSNATLGSNVTIRGTVIVGSDLTVNGTNVTIEPQDVPALDGTTAPIRLPCVIVLDDLYVASGAQAAVTGVTYVADDFEILEGTEATSLAITGNVIVGRKITIDQRTEWKAYSGSQWDTFFAAFQAQLQAAGAVPHFPVWMATLQNRNYVPLITVQPEAGTVLTQWQNLSNPLFVVKTGDSGLHWDLERWIDNP